jgi:hypothetical protein
LTRGIYLIANRQSREECWNLIFSIRGCGCRLPIRIIPYGDEPLRADPKWEDVRLLSINEFSAEGLSFVDELKRRMPQCPMGLLRRFFCWFGEFDEFLYSDNDIVALMNWEELFSYLDTYDLVHADLEHTTNAVYNMRQPARFEELMGPGSLEFAMTAGHFLCRPKPRHRSDLLAGLAWMETHPDVPIWHDQALMHVTLALAKWPVLNLCKPPHNWAGTHAGSYENAWEVIRAIQLGKRPISHLHFSGGVASGTSAIDELLLVNLPEKERKRKLMRALAWEASGLKAVGGLAKRAARRANRAARGSR